MIKSNRSERGIVYIRKSVQGDKLSPLTQLEWAMQEAHYHSVEMNASEQMLEEMLRIRASHEGDIYIDIGISGAKMQRPGFDAFLKRAIGDKSITHCFIYMQDRLARPNDPAEAILIENQLRRAGKTVVFSDKELKPLGHGEADIINHLLSALAYHGAGQDLKKLAERIVTCQAKLANDGYWTGGRPPYGFVRILVGPDNNEIRELENGERVRQAGCHVRIKPKDTDKIETWLEIIEMRAKNRWGMKRIANELNRRGIPSPDAGRMRHDRYGQAYEVSGKWSPSTLSSLLRNRAIIGQLSWGVHSEGAHRRIGKDGPRCLLDSDITESGRLRVILNPESMQVIRPAGYEPLMPIDIFEEMQKSLKARGKSQRGSTRSPDPYRYPLAGNIVDASPGCGWPMYGRKPGKTRKYVCGQYTATGGCACEHNTIPVDWLNRTVLDSVRQAVLMGELRAEIEKRVRAIAEAAANTQQDDKGLARATSELASLEAKCAQAQKNMANASDPRVFNAVQEIFLDLDSQATEKCREVETLGRKSSSQSEPSVEQQIEQAMSLLDDLGQLAEHGGQPELKQLFDALDVRVWAWFKKVPEGKRLLNKLDRGLITTGNATWPIEPYNGPRNGSAVKKRKKADIKKPEPIRSLDRADSDSSHKGNRGDWI
jgi:DNA invertase Pin-like site-specific DNA recombinase